MHKGYSKPPWSVLGREFPKEYCSTRSRKSISTRWGGLINNIPPLFPRLIAKPLYLLSSLTEIATKITPIHVLKIIRSSAGHHPSKGERELFYGAPYSDPKSRILPGVSVLHNFLLAGAASFGLFLPFELAIRALKLRPVFPVVLPPTAWTQSSIPGGQTDPFPLWDSLNAKRLARSRTNCAKCVCVEGGGS